MSSFIEASTPFVNLREGEFGVAIISAVVLVLFYGILRSIKSELRARSWILSLASSLTMSICGVIYSVKFFNQIYYSGMHNLEIFVISDDELSRTICIFFKVFLFIDIIIGMLDYKSQVQFLSGWFHHIFYAGFLSWILTRNLSVGFALVTPLEFPTFLLALGTVFPSLRTDLSFGIVFFTTRILYHGFVIYLFYQFETVMLWPTILALWGLHWHWFLGWMRSMNKKRKIAKSKSNEVSSPIMDERTHMKQLLSNETKQE